MNALILCAGMGSRFNKEKKVSKPKCLIEFNKKKIIDLQIKALNRNNIKNIAIVTGYESQLINHCKIKKIYINQKWNETNMIYSMFCASDWIDNKNCIISYGDIFYSASTISNLIKSQENINILYHEDFMKMWQGRYKNPYDDLESFQVDEFGYLTEIGAKVTKKDNIMGQFMGLILIKKDGWKIINKELKKINISKIDFTSLLKYLIEKNIRVKCFPTNDIWGEIDTKEDLIFYQNYYADRL